MWLASWLSNFPGFRLLGMSVSWFFGVVAAAGGEGVQRSPDACLREGHQGLLNESLPPRGWGGRKGVAVSSCFCYTTRLNESLPGLPAKGGTGRNRGLGEEFTVC